ncbi:hypothetical protein [Cupriavidus sp. AcVe19-6a]|uniref:hypothetical protein n=1 Tax=Cupriavidus sp. AcVe19-6a TaxID=2821358 RepID=UPI001AE0EB6C|nr:hypothetical protein [Cupriavidus sp. AcVe19-6a]MBP0634896.1 hypothetical protein [Cupriavidus sp. AcVe19-6a]
MAKIRSVTIEDPRTGKCGRYEARTWPSMPKRYQERAGTLNGKPYLFLCTRGAGRGAITRYYAYAQVGDDIWYVDTGNDFLQDGAAVDFA